MNWVEEGLSTQEVILKQQKFGLNILPVKPPRSYFYIFLQQLKNPLIYVLLLAGLITVFVGDFADSLIIFFAVFINTILGFIQESKASNALSALKHYVTHHSLVIRNGQRVNIETRHLVPGDIVVLNQGFKVPADGKLIHTNRFLIDESVLTGESVSVKKSQNDFVFMGTTVFSGQAIMLVESIGVNTKMGDIALQVQETEENTPLQKQLNKLSKQLLIVVGILVGIVLIVGLLHQFNFSEIFITSVALAVSSIPEGLAVSLTVVLAIGMQKILKRRGLVRKLSAAETLGGITVICTDKTGTLTEGKMTVVDVIGNKVDIAHQITLANDLDDPLVVAAFQWAQTIIKNLSADYPRLDSIPFSSKEKYFISLHKLNSSSNRIFVNGAPEFLLKWSNLSKKEKVKNLKIIDDLTKEGKRLIGLARKDVSINKTMLNHSDAKKKLVWVGLLAFSDPVRPSAKEAISQASTAGIRTIVITGDYPKTSQFVLSQLGISLMDREILTGEEIQSLTIKELSQKVKTVKLFARTTPDQKNKIIESLKRNGEVVAMMGDGVNDAPALHKADIGIAIGNATDVAKESADLVLLDSNFSTIIAAIEEGRTMFDNIRKIILYLMSDAFTEIIIVLGGIILGLPLPITAIQILWINLISDGFPSLALTIDPKRDNIMNEIPRATSESLVNGWMAVLIGLISISAGLLALLSFTIVYKTSGDVVLARSVAFATIGLDSLIYVFSIRTLMIPFWKNNLFENKWLIVAVFAGIILQIVPFLNPSLRHFFGLANLSPSYWIAIISISIFMFSIIEIFKFFYYLISHHRHDSVI